MGRDVALGEILTIQRDEVTLEPGESYRTAGIYSFGRGAFERGTILGAETSYRTLFRLHENQVVLSRLNGWEGAVDVVDAGLAGCFVSNEYPTFSVDRGRADPAFLRWITRWPTFWDRLVPRGSMVRRKRVQPAQFLEVRIPLPPIDEQRRVAVRLDVVSNAARRASAKIDKVGTQAFLQLLPALVDTIVAGVSIEQIAVGEAAAFVSDTVHPGDDPKPATSFVGLQHIESHTGRCLGSDALGPMKGRKFRFQPGDVLFGYLRPYLNKVWLADCHGLCSVDQYVLRPRDGVAGALLAHCLRGRRVLNHAIDLTHSLQLPRLRSGLLAALQIPAVAEGNSAPLVARLDGLRDQIVQVTAMRRHQENLVAALLPALLNEAFAGLR